MVEITLNRQYPIFLCKVEKDKLISTFDWHRTIIIQDDKFIRMNDLESRLKRKFYKDVYYKNEEGELIKVLDKDNVNFCINSETLYGQNIIECIDYNGEGMGQLGVM